MGIERRTFDLAYQEQMITACCTKKWSLMVLYNISLTIRYESKPRNIFSIRLRGIAISQEISFVWFVVLFTRLRLMLINFKLDG